MLIRSAPTASAAPDPDGCKRWRDGSDRVIDPAATLARVRPMLPQLGITRIGMLTGLDVIGIPVAAAYRPNSRSVAVHQGKGVSDAAAQVSAAMEALECWHAETPDLPLRLASAEEIAAIGTAVDPDRLPRSAGGGDPFAERLLWVEGRDLAQDRPVFVPYELVAADYTAPAPPGSGMFQATTNGLASGNHWLEAVTHGLYEVVERDATALWHAAPVAQRRDRTLDLATVTGPCSALLGRFARAGVAVTVWDVTTEIGLPCFLALALDPRGGSVEPELGAGCHADREVALSRALTEAAQARLTRISGARDDFALAGYAAAGRGARETEAEGWRGVRGRRRFAAAPAFAGPTLRHDLDAALERLTAAGFGQVIAIDLTRAEFGVPVARIIVPGLEGPFDPDGGWTPGPRARSAAGPER